MFKKIIFFTYTLYLHILILYALDDVICPSEQLWYFRAKSVCSNVQNYTCLLDSVNNIYKESCNGPRIEPPGDKTVVNSGNFDTESCRNNRFQPFPFSTTKSNDCIFMKTLCSGEGQIVHSNGTSRHDRECRCDYTRGFSFLSNRIKRRCHCDPTTEDCSCFKKVCGKGEILSPDYSCIKQEDAYGKFVCEEIENTQGQITDVALRGIKVGGRYKSMKRESEERAGAIISMTFTVIMIADRNPESIIPLDIDQTVNHLKDANEDNTSKPSLDSLPNDFDKTIDDDKIEEETTAHIAQINANVVNDPLRLAFEGTHIQTGDDICIPERVECEFKISDEVFKDYKNDLYIVYVLNDLIDKNVICIYKSHERTTPHMKEEREKDEHEFIHTTINKQRNNDIILRRNVDPSFGKIFNDLKGKVTSGIKYGVESFGQLINME